MLPLGKPTVVAIFKRWEDHSARWQREHSAAGETKAKWNRFLKLSGKTRKGANIREYAKGVSVPAQRKTKAVTTAITRMKSLGFGREYVIERGAEHMTAVELRWTSTASIAQIKLRAGNKKYVRNGINPWWYR